MPKKLKILVSAYACAPNKGSEPGMGWNFVTGLAKFHELHVIVEKRKWEKPINDFLENNPELNDSVTFYFIDKKRNKPLRKIWPPSYYWFYKKWQKEAYNLALELDQKENFDLIHQLNMVGYREPGYLWKIDKPFVWGPIGGLENSSWSFLPSLGLKGFLFYAARNVINLWQRNFLTRPKLAVKRKNSAVIAATPDNKFLIKKLWNKDSTIISEVGQELNQFPKINIREKSEALKIIWSGQHTEGKNLQLLLKALKDVNFNFQLHVLGQGVMTSYWKNLANRLGIEEQIIWHGWVYKSKTFEVLINSHVFCITSIKDLTSTVTLEALSFGLPIICLNHCGFSHVVNDSCGIKINVSTPKKAATDFSVALEKIYTDESIRQSLSQGAFERAKDFSWDSKINRLNTIYNELLKNQV
ncbi:glycosyltransferase [Flavobacteriaceae bacterium]|nr:glycosyltransferase [Flavobacteriaceae bacterium]